VIQIPDQLLSFESLRFHHLTTYYYWHLLICTYCYYHLLITLFVPVPDMHHFLLVALISPLCLSFSFFVFNYSRIGISANIVCWIGTVCGSNTFIYHSGWLKPTKLDTGGASGLFFICGCNNDQVVNRISIGHRMYACIEKEMLLQRADDGILKYLMVCTSLLQQFNN
jgi:hypothetical protein